MYTHDTYTAVDIVIVFYLKEVKDYVSVRVSGTSCKVKGCSSKFILCLDA